MSEELAKNYKLKRFCQKIRNLENFNEETLLIRALSNISCRNLLQVLPV